MFLFIVIGTLTVVAVAFFVVVSVPCFSDSTKAAASSLFLKLESLSVVLYGICAVNLLVTLLTPSLS